MCGRYNLVDDPLTRKLLELLGIPALPEPRVNLAPTEHAPAVIREGREQRVEDMRWWLVPSWSPGPDQKYSMFNARSESLEKSRAFRGPFRRHRAIIPASSFIEWHAESGRKVPYAITGVERGLALAAVWDHWEKGEQSLLSFAIVTTEAPEEFRHIHDRMPVILRQEEFDPWLDTEVSTEDLHPFFVPRIAHDLQIYPLSTQINSSRNKAAELLEAVGPIEVLSAG